MNRIKKFFLTPITVIKKIKKFFFIRKVEFALRFLSSLQTLMKNAGFTRQEIRQFWRDMAKEENQKKTINYLRNKLEILKK